MIFFRKLNLVVFCLVMLGLANSISANPFTKKKDDVIRGAEHELGELQSYVEMGDKWMFVEGSKDKFLMTKNGRFAISVENGELTLTDIWQVSAIPFADYKKALEVYPLDILTMVPGEAKEPPIWFKFGNGQVKATVFGIPGNPFVNALMEQVDWANADFSIHYYVVPHLDAKDWVRYVCAPRSVQRAQALGEKIELEEPAKGACDTRKALEHAPRIGGMMMLMDIKSVPFVIRHSDWVGKGLNGGVKDSLKEFLRD